MDTSADRTMNTNADGLTFIKVASLGLDERYAPVLELWILRILFSLDDVEQQLRDSLAELPVGDGDSDEGAQAPRIERAITALKEAHARLEALAPQLPDDTTLAINIARLGDRFGLTAVERELLHFVVLQRLCSQLHEMLNAAGELNRIQTVRLLSTGLSRSMADIQQALSATSRLCRCALLTMDDARSYTFEFKIDLPSGLTEALWVENKDLIDLFPNAVTPAPASPLGLDDFAHLRENLVVLSTYLEAAVRQGRRGINILIHGRSGTGKTELARVLAQAAGLQALEIPVRQPDGKPHGGKARFESFRFAQNLLSGTTPAALIFDEVDDVFEYWSSDRQGRHSNSSGIKGWVNHALEHNPVPTFWLTNDLQGLDFAYRRRFDYVLEMEVPPQAVRRRMLERHLQTHALPLPPAWIEQASRHEGLAPGLIERAVRVCATVAGTESCSLGPEQILTQVMNNTLHAMQMDRLPSRSAAQGAYRIDWLHADTDLQRLRDGLVREGAGRLCFWGLPGTGKTEFGRHLAREVGRPLLVRRASDLLSPYVGVAERQIAQMFDQARREGAVLLLDEADSFLMDRRGAQRSWEITQVNEMLTQMEAFDGVFIASTNLIDQVDRAALRRFDVCIRFGPLKPTQAREMLQDLAQHWGWSVDETCLARVAALEELTPGDFASVRRGGRLSAPRDVQDLVQRLAQICEMRQGRSHRGIGFLGPLERGASPMQEMLS
ncbi:AAA family ATPase [Sphaerotilus natans]|nr:AAA family ATPase [Sphaerotilus natans]